MDGFRIDFTPPLVTERSARIVESEGIQDEKHRGRQDSKRKRRKRQHSDDGKEDGDEGRRKQKTGKSIDVEA